jgi:hypothetical protein
MSTTYFISATQRPGQLENFLTPQSSTAVHAESAFTLNGTLVPYHIHHHHFLLQT